MTNTCIVPKLPEHLDAQDFDTWNTLHKHHSACARNNDPNVVLIGASNIQFIEQCPIWDEKFVPLNSLNFGIAGDLVENVLWRVKDGVLNNVKPKVCILNVGSNNLGSNTPVQIAEGICAVVQEIRSILPDCYIMVIGILPRGPYPDLLRKLGTQTNEHLGQKVKKMSKVGLFDADLLQPDGSLHPEDAPDYLHPSDKGYRKIFDPIFPKINDILNSQ